MHPSFASLNSSIRVVLVDVYGDGTVWFSFEDSDNQHATVCIDGRENSQTRHRLFDRAKHPSKQEATLLELGGLEEGIIVPLVSKSLDSNSPRKLNLTDYGWGLFETRFYESVNH